MSKGLLLETLAASILAATFLAGALATSADAAVLWQIGEADGKTNEFALGPNGYMQYRSDALYIVGRSEPRRDWPYVQPGPSDVWAGPREHTFTVVFNVAELPDSASGEVRLELHLADTHSQNPPRLAISLNGESRSVQTTRGGGDASIMQGKPGRPSRPAVAWPLSALTEGPNKLEILNAEGSWFLYDAVQLQAPENVTLGEAPAFYRISRVEDSILIGHTPEPTQSLRVEILAAADQPADVELLAHIEGVSDPVEVSQSLTVRPGMQWVDLAIPRLRGWPANVTVSLRVGGEVVSTGTTNVHPHRDWTVYLTPHSHVDIGYTEVQTKILESQQEFLRDAMAFIEEHPDLPDDAQFCWNVEVLWAVKTFLDKADAKERERFFRHVRRGTVGLDALFGNELTGLCAPEELARLVDYAGRLAREHDLTIDSAMITDVPGWTWGTAAVLAEAGVRYFDIAPNANARLGNLREVWEERPFYWETPDGTKRVLTWMSTPGYYRMYGLLKEPQDANNLLRYLQSLEKNPNYPYTVTKVRMCTGDNGPPELRLSEFVRDWNERYSSPRLVLAKTRDAFVHLEKEFGDRIPTHRGTLAPYWEDGAGSSADETARARRAAKSMVAAETIWAVERVGEEESASSRRRLQDELDKTWDNVLLYDEHTWGAFNSISEPDADFVKQQWAIKGAFARDAERDADRLVQSGLEALAANIETGDDVTIVVFNPCSWERTDVARYRTDEGAPFAIVDSRGDRLAHVMSDDGVVSFIARDVPALGYRTYCIVQPESAGEPLIDQAVANPETGRLKSRHFDVTLDPKTAAIARIESPGGFLKSDSALTTGGFNRYIYNTEGDPKRIAFAENASLQWVPPDSPDGAALVMRSKAPGCIALEQKIEVHGELPWIDIANTVERGDVRVPEGLYFDFPFQTLEGAKMRYEAPWTPVRLEEDLLPGSCRNFLCVQHGVELRGKDQSVVLTPIDAPLIEVGEIHENTRHHQLRVYESLDLQPPRVLSFVMNNYWFTNYRAHQPGTVTFRYRLYRTNGGNDVELQRFGLAARQPLRTVLVAGGNEEGPLPGDEHSFVRVKPDNVIVTIVKAAESGGTLVRLHEIAGKRATASLRLDGFGDIAERVDLWERPIGKVEMRRGAFRVPIEPRGIVTVRVAAHELP